MQLFGILYIIAAIVAIGACVPQVTRLLRTKQSDGFYFRTWVIWAMTQMVTLLYVVSIGDWLMTAVNVVWVSFYVVMSVLILRYRFIRPVTDGASTPAPTLVAAHVQAQE